ncbi:MAG: ABC-type uncharacterized transport system, permease component [Francisellaceae bacterium]|nr:ABC-type uncharacterized transport system, permease component [Francisellaceae bacterium]
MQLQSISLLALVLYSIAAFFQIMYWNGRLILTRPYRLLLGYSAVWVHVYGLYVWIFARFGPHFSLSSTASLILCFISLITLIGSFKKKSLEMLSIFILPLSGLSLIPSFLFHPHIDFPAKLYIGKIIHIFISIIAISILGLGALQAILVAIQNFHLRNKHNSRVVSLLPPLETTEKLLFQIIGAGFILLTLDLVQGLIFLENLFVVPRLTKTFLSILAWCLFAILLYGHYQKGWRGPTAIRWTILGVFVLSFAYFGSTLLRSF